jgi:glyoxalase-like protein
MLLGIDHIVVAVADPDLAVAQLGEALGVEPSGGGRHDRLGTFNRLLWLGDSFIELIGIFERDLAASSWIGAPTVRSMDRGGGLATWAIATDDIAADVDLLRATASDLSDPIDGERVRLDAQVVRWRLATPPVLEPSSPPFLIEHDPTAAEWTSADRALRAAGPGRLRGIELVVPDAESTATWFARTLGIAWRRPAGSPPYETRIGDHFVRLQQGDQRDPVNRDPVNIAVAIEGTEPTTFELLGCKWTVHD